MNVVAFTGIRDIDPVHADDVELAVLDEVAAAGEFRFGGALGSDTLALRAACGLSPHKVGFVPFRVTDQPAVAQAALRDCADTIVELDLPRSKRAYLDRNATMLDGADRVVAFWDGRESGGTWWTMNEAARRQIPVRVVSVGGARANPEIPGDWAAPVFAWRPYVSGRTGAADRASEVVRALKKGTAGARDILWLADELAAYIRSELAMTGIQAVVGVPRRDPSLPPSLDPVLASLAATLDWRYVRGWLVRHEPPIGGRVRAFRLRFDADEHARTISVQGESLGRVLVVDDVLTFGGTMNGSLRSIVASGKGVPVGLAVLYSASVEQEP